MVTSPAERYGAPIIAGNVAQALRSNSPVVALESALITHGLPFPGNVEVAQQVEMAVADEGATPATIAVIQGRIHVGLTAAQRRALAGSKSNHKIGIRDLASAAVKHTGGGTTVAATMFAATMAGIRVFATGGIGGVHRDDPLDVSADLAVLAKTPMIVVSAGAKAILDLRATLEYLETMSVPVIGYRTDEFPAFYARTSGLQVSVRLESPDEIAEYWEAHAALGMQTALLIANPIPGESALPPEEMEDLIQQASRQAAGNGARGQALTPFLLGRINELSGGRSTQANAALLVNNASLAGKIAVAVASRGQRMETQA